MKSCNLGPFLVGVLTGLISMLYCTSLEERNLVTMGIVLTSASALGALISKTRGRLDGTYILGLDVGSGLSPILFVLIPNSSALLATLLVYATKPFDLFALLATVVAQVIMPCALVGSLFAILPYSMIKAWQETASQNKPCTSC